MLLNSFRFGIPEEEVPDTYGYFARMSNQPSNPLKLNINTFRAAVESIWDGFDTFQFYQIGHDSQSGLLDLVRPEISAVMHGNASFLPNVGVKGFANGSSYIDTLYNPSVDGVNYTLDNASMGCYVNSLPSVTTTFFGYSATVSGHASFIQASAAGSLTSQLNSMTNRVVSDAAAAGFYIHTRDTNIDWSLYHDGVALFEDQTGGSTNGMPEGNIYVCARNRNNTDLLFPNTVEIGCFFAGRYFDTSEQLILQNAIEAFRAAL